MDENEPNNQLEDAQYLYGPSPVGIRGNVSVSDQGSSHVQGDDLEDLYLFTLNSGPLKVRLCDIVADVDVYLLKIEGTTSTVWISNHRGSTTEEVLERDDLEPGEYYLGVSVFDDHPINPDSPYTLSIEGDLLSNVGAGSLRPASLNHLDQNRPNPFSDQTTIRCTIGRSGRVIVRILDVAGREVCILADRDCAPGEFSLTWHGTDGTGHKIPPGVYYYSLETPGQVLVKKLMLVR